MASEISANNPELIESLRRSVGNPNQPGSGNIFKSMSQLLLSLIDSQPNTDQNKPGSS